MACRVERSTRGGGGGGEGGEGGGDVGGEGAVEEGRDLSRWGEGGGGRLSFFLSCDLWEREEEEKAEGGEEVVGGKGLEVGGLGMDWRVGKGGMLDGCFHDSV